MREGREGGGESWGWERERQREREREREREIELTEIKTIMTTILYNFTMAKFQCHMAHTRASSLTNYQLLPALEEPYTKKGLRHNEYY